jgi:phage/plasmid-associated DNA primase
MQITAIAFQYQIIHLACYQSHQSQIIQYHPNQSTFDEAGETLTKKQKVKHAASMLTFDGAASGRYTQKKSVASEEPNMRYQMQMTKVRKGTTGIREMMPS